MAATAIPLDALPSLDPATGETLGYVQKTPLANVAYILSLSRAVQADWVRLPIAQRCSLLRALRDRILSSRHTLADAVVRESGKPRAEALFADVFVALD